ncbi:TetR/AcrR family transcriptional regulator [Winogradskya consettensis]|uniref:TetR family transcriptional regulator n=1 Tax=Winogradskya consettensis TaxID=113560 RepID=A0A919VMV8_9ACTN|nr:TetR/AcrR family transcriptional regulator [Actinoplanes consettensis]GIM69421.1 TetR family transcriptional regulator [Actinoplanes consettensis]
MSRTADRPAQGEVLSRAVWDVLADQGLERLTVRAVAAAAGCTTGLVMHRFPNRRALLVHARELLHETTKGRVEALEARAATPREALRAVLQQGMAIDPATARESVVWTGFLAAAVADDELLAMHRRNNRAWRERVERLVAAAAPEWPAARVASVALGLIAMTEGVAALGAADPVAYPVTDQERMLDDALDAYGLDAGTVRRGVL